MTVSVLLEACHRSDGPIELIHKFFTVCFNSLERAVRACSATEVTSVTSVFYFQQNFSFVTTFCVTGRTTRLDGSLIIPSSLLQIIH